MRELRIFDAEDWRRSRLALMAPYRFPLAGKACWFASRRKTSSHNIPPAGTPGSAASVPASPAIRRFAAGIQLRQQRQRSQSTPDRKPPQEPFSHRYPPKGRLHRPDAPEPDERRQVLAIGKVGTDVAARGKFPNKKGRFFLKGDYGAVIAEDTGGQIGNIAFGLRCLGADVFLIAPVAYDDHGIALREGYQRRGINTDYLVT